MMNTKSTCSSLKIHPRHHILEPDLNNSVRKGDLAPPKPIGKGNARGVGERSDVDNASLLSYRKCVVKKSVLGRNP